MTPDDPIRVDAAVVDDRWGHVTAERFVLDDDPRAPGSAFSLCTVDGQPIAVFLASALAGDARNEIAARCPAWLTAIVFADVASCDSARAVIDAEIGFPADADADVARCAFAVACAALDAGTLNESPARYWIRLANRAAAVDVTMVFDEVSESWHGEVSGRPGF